MEKKVHRFDRRAQFPLLPVHGVTSGQRDLSLYLSNLAKVEYRCRARCADQQEQEDWTAWCHGFSFKRYRSGRKTG
jgi:hypothetical protein